MPKITFRLQRKLDVGSEVFRKANLRGSSASYLNENKIINFK